MAVSPSPLPLPPAPPAPGGLDLMLRAAAGAVPGGSPEIVNAAAQSSATPDDAATAAQATTSYMTTANAAQQLKAQSISYQRQFFDNAPGQVQDQLRAAGYSPPGSSSGGFGGFLHRAVHDVLHNPVTHVIGEGLTSRPVADVLNVAGSGLRFAQHLERTAMAAAADAETAVGNGEENVSGLWGMLTQGSAGNEFKAWGRMFTPSEWANAWDETNSGKSYILPQVKRQAQDAFDPDTYQLALKLATGANPQSIIQAASPDQQQALAEKLTSDPQLHRAVAMLNDGHLSVGQFVVGEHFLVNHPGLGHALSGLTDATMDWFGDPLVVGGKLAKGASTARWLVQSGDDVRALANGSVSLARPTSLVNFGGSAGFNRALEDIAARYRTQGADATAGLLQRYPKLEPVLSDMATKAGQLTTRDDVLNYFADDLAGTASIISGNAAHVAGKAGGVVPHLTWAGQARLAAKGALTKTIDFAADHPNTLEVDPGDVIDHPLNPPGPIKTLTVGTAQGVLRKTGMSARRLTTLVSEKPTFDATDPRALSQLRNILLYALPADRADQLVNTFAATPDIGMKRSIYFGAMKELGHGFGIDEDSAFWQKYLSRFTSEGPDNVNSPTRLYAPGDIGSFDIDSTPTNVGILAKDAPTEWGVPDFRKMYMEGKKSGMLRSVVGASNTDFADKFMKPWRNLTLARPGFGFRVAGDEAFAGMLRDGPLAYTKARLATSFANRTAAASAAAVRDDEIASTYDRLLGHLPQRVRDRIQTPVDAVAANLGNTTARAMAGVDTVMPESKYVQAARNMAAHGVNDPDGAFSRHISSSEHPFDADIKATAGRIVYLKDGSMVPAEIAKTGAYKNYDLAAGGLHTQMWHKTLSDLAADAWARTSLEHIDDAPLDRISAVADHIQANPEFWSRFVRSLGTRDGRLVATGEVTARQAAEDHALAVNQLVDSAVLDPNGDHIAQAWGAPGETFGTGDQQNLAAHLLEHRRPPSVNKLEQVDEVMRPETVKGPEYQQVVKNQGGLFQNLANKMFEKIIGPQIDWMSRQPLFVHNYATSWDAYASMRRKWEKTLGPRTMTEVTDRAGQPLRVYHGSPRDIADISGNVPHAETPGISYFTADPTYASQYAMQSEKGERWVDNERLFTTQNEAQAFHDSLYDQGLRKGLYLDDEDPSEIAVRWSEPAVPRVEMRYLDMRNPFYSSKRGYFGPEEVARMKAQGYDGIIYGEGGGGGRFKSFVVFDDAQIHRAPDDLITQGAKNLDELQHHYATARAINLTTPYIHNPDLKSQFSVLTRNLAPFWFAQEQFYKRWARTMAVAPWGFRQAQLVNGGLIHSGFVHTDPQTGQEYFVYPGSSIVTDALSKTLSGIGIDSYLPVNGSLTGQIKALSPGFERPGIPNLGPFLVAPMNALKTIDPDFTKAIDAIEGKQAASQGVLKPFIPGNLQRLADLVNPDLLDHSQYASAQMQAIQYLEATGHGISQPAINNLGNTNTVGPPPAGTKGQPGDYVTDARGQPYVAQPDGTWRRNDPIEQQQYLQRVKNWARIFLMSRAVFGFSAPAAPEAQFNPDNLHNDLQTYLKELPFNEAVGAFLKQHPDATAYTVFQTKSGDGTPPPATAKAMDFYDTNRPFMDAHRDAGSYFIPQPATKGPFDLAAYQEQMAEGFRLKKAPSEFYNDVQYALSARTYFQALDNKNKLVAAPPAGMTASQVSQQWDQWSKQFMAVNPVFADQLTSSNGTLKRAQIMEDVGQALNDPALPPTPQTEDIATLYTGWRNWQLMIGPSAGTNAPHLSTSTKNYLDGQFALWAEAYVKAHPDVQALYDKAIHPSLISTLDSLAARGVTA
jgi:hypothetical protein